ncbi:MAG: VanZ family protein [Nitrospinae bacterium]|nr:VanZ family protein [Nitrospinota bacterium]
MNLFNNKFTARAVTAGYVFIIYLTTGLMGSVQVWLRQRGFLTVASGLLLVAGAGVAVYFIVARLGRRKPKHLVILAASAAAYFVLSVKFAKTPSDRIHLLEYSLLAALAYYTVKFNVKGWPAYPGAWLLATMAGLMDEAIQRFLPNRAADMRDFLVNAISAAVALLVVRLVIEENDEVET